MRRRKDVHLPTADLVRAGFDKVWSSDCLEGVVLFSGGIGGPTTLREIRQAIAGVFEARWQQMYDEVASLSGPPNGQSVAYYWCTHNKVLHSQAMLPADKVRRLEGISWWSWQDGFESSLGPTLRTGRGPAGVPEIRDGRVRLGAAATPAPQGRQAPGGADRPLRADRLVDLERLRVAMGGRISEAEGRDRATEVADQGV